MNPRILLATLFGGARASAHGGQLLSRKELHALAGTVQAWAGHLLLPALTPEQRMQMSRGDLPGLAGLALTLRDLLLTLPDLQAALEMTVQVFDALRHKGLELLTISERARDIGDEAAAGQAAVLEHLQRTCDEITGAAERLRDEASTPAAERGLLSACPMARVPSCCWTAHWAPVRWSSYTLCSATTSTFSRPCAQAPTAIC